ncbi:uncharacterized protein F5891DRAFT_1182358 [Suillus fuscotomentosus]|uniref:Uncharacterized protein n=1 Tax=Suillus fuscotomentosus TaxID=1912939 RepID=A0AAD4EHC4_9AGAM|nr:uncharacterized protein F5891DRAFT_1182358 [Suillus fuscotomentosus]KAG1906157.1 hypothetical protein F5891DRAFT_1182358 [Suillus fuscotomentosus]
MSSSNANIAATNKAFSDAADKIEHLLGQAWQLDAGDPEHLTIAMEMGRALTQAMMSHGGSVTVLSPLILSAAAELQQHMNASRTGLTGTPAWGNIRGDDIRIKTHPLFPSTRNYQRSPSASASPPRPGPSQLSKRPAMEEPEERRRGIERGKHPCASSARSRSRPAMSKRQRQKSKAIITSDDELEEEEPASPVITTNKKARRAYVEVDTEEETEDDGDEEDAVEPPRKITAAPVAKPMTSGPDLMEDEFANTMTEAYHKDHGGKLRMCTLCSRLKIRCGGKGSEAPKMKPKSVMARCTRSQSWRRHSPPPAPAAFVAPAASQEQLPPPQVEIWAKPAPPSIPNQEMQDLRDKVAGLRATVETLLQQVANGDRQFRESLAAQDRRADLLEAELEVLRQLVVSATAQPAAGTDPLDVPPGEQTPPALTTQPPPDTPASDMQPGTEPSSAPTEDTSIPLGATPAGTSIEANVELATGPATPHAEIACLLVAMKAADDAIM